MTDKFFLHESSFVDEGAVIGDGARIWHFSHIMKGVRMGPDCVVGQNCLIGPNVSIGRGVKVQNNISIYEGVTVEDDVFLGPSMVFTNVMNPRAFVERKDEFKPTLLRRGCTIGANATLVCGITVGRYAMVGAGSVVTRDVPDFALVFGSPARLNGWMSIRGNRLDFDPDGHAIDPEDGRRYRLKNNQVVTEDE